MMFIFAQNTILSPMPPSVMPHFHCNPSDILSMDRNGFVNQNSQNSDNIIAGIVEYKSKDV